MNRKALGKLALELQTATSREEAITAFERLDERVLKGLSEKGQKELLMIVGRAIASIPPQE